MPKVKPEPVSSPNSPRKGGGRKKSSTKRRRHKHRSHGAKDSSVNLPSDEADSSRPSTFLRTRSRVAQNKPEAERNSSHSNPDSDDSAEEAEIPDPPAGTHRRRSNAHSSLHKGNTETYIKTVAKYSPAVAVPRTTSSKRKDGTDKRTLHRFTNEEHRFIWFYRNDLQCSRGDTYVHFNEYFGLEIRKDSIANTYERLRQKRPLEICSVRHIEPWALGQSHGTQTKQSVVILDEESAHDWSEGGVKTRSAGGGCTQTPAGIEQAPLPGLGLTKLENKGPSKGKPARRNPAPAMSSPTRDDDGRNARAQDRESRKRSAGTRASDSSPQPKPKRRSYHRRHPDSSPTPQAHTRTTFGKRRVGLDVDSTDRGGRVGKGKVGSDDHE